MNFSVGLLLASVSVLALEYDPSLNISIISFQRDRLGWYLKEAWRILTGRVHRQY